MANEPERPIEKLLRAAAKKRRDEAGAAFELHPANRRLLQGEVARKFAKAQRETRSFSEVLAQLWPRFAWGVAIFAVLGVTVWVLLPVPGKGKPEALLVRNETVREARPAKEPSPPPPAPEAVAPAPPAPMAEGKPATVELAYKAQAASAAAPQPADRGQTVGANITASGSLPAQTPARMVDGAYQRQLGLATNQAPPAAVPTAPAAPPPATMPPAAATVVAMDESAGQAGGKADQPALAYKALDAAAPAKRSRSAPTTTASFAKAAAADQLKSQSTTAVQYFTQVAPAKKAKSALADKATPAHAVLASFQVQQTGDELRIVDGDGSVYSGHVRLADATRRARPAKAEVPAASRASRAAEGVLEEEAVDRLDSDRLALQTYSFRVAGTNRSLNKQVVFTGNLLAATNLTQLPPVTTNLSIGGGLGGVQNAPSQQGLLPLLNTRISGKVVIGSGKAIEINALPTSP